MNKILSKIYYWLAFSYLLIYLSGFAFLKSDLFNYFHGIWLYLFSFILLFVELGFIILLPHKVQCLERNHALLFLVFHSLLLGILLLIVPRVLGLEGINDYLINDLIGFLILAPIFAIIGFFPF